MTDHMPKVVLLSAIETQQAEPIKLDFREDREQTSAMSLVLKGGDTFLVADACGDFLVGARDGSLLAWDTFLANLQSLSRRLSSCAPFPSGCCYGRCLSH